MHPDSDHTTALPAEPARKTEDFYDLRVSGQRHGTSYAIGHPVAVARDRMAGFLTRCGATPNSVTVFGFLMTAGAGVCLALGASHTPYHIVGGISSGWNFLAFCLLVVAGACDMLDGAVARVGGKSTLFGQVLDSTLDRFSDSALYVGIVLHYAVLGNVTVCTLAVVALIHTYSISYIKARSDNLIDSCSVGWWQRPERCVGFLTGTLFGHIPALLWQQATVPFLSVVRRIRYTAEVMRAQGEGKEPPQTGPFPGIWRYVGIWRFPRGSVPYDVMAFINIGWTIVAPWIWPFFYGRTDPLRDLLGRWIH